MRFIFVFEGGVNLDFKHSSGIFTIDTALKPPPIKIEILLTSGPPLTPPKGTGKSRSEG